MMMGEMVKKGLKKSVGEDARLRGRSQGQRLRAKLGQQSLHGYWVKDEKPTDEKWALA